MMPRGAKRSVETQIADIEAKKAQLQTRIDSYKAKIAELDRDIKELQDSKKKKELENLLEAIKASGKSPEEVLAALNAERNAV